MRPTPTRLGGGRGATASGMLSGSRLEDADVSWPVPPPAVDEVEPPSGWSPADAPPSTTVEHDGSIWLHDRGQTRRVAPPGTDHYKVRFDARAMPAVDLVLTRVRDEDDKADGHHERRPTHELAREVVELVDGDDIALLMAQAFAGRVGLKKANDGDLEGAKTWLRIVDVLASAVFRAQQEWLPDTAQDEVRAAVARWRENSS